MRVCVDSGQLGRSGKRGPRCSAGVACLVARLPAVGGGIARAVFASSGSAASGVPQCPSAKGKW
eukprot:6963418-Alexandrium_andersonii.AAC.1